MVGQSSRREPLADVAYRARDPQNQAQAQPDVTHATGQHGQHGDRAIDERLIHRQSVDLRTPTGIAGEQCPA